MEGWAKGNFTGAKKTVVDVDSKVHFLQPEITTDFDLDCYLCNMRPPMLSTHALVPEPVPDSIFADREYNLVLDQMQCFKHKLTGKPKAKNRTASL